MSYILVCRRTNNVLGEYTQLHFAMADKRRFAELNTDHAGSLDIVCLDDEAAR